MRKLNSQTQFARANALASYKAKSMTDITTVSKCEYYSKHHPDKAKTARIVLHIHHEMGLHIEYCKGFGMAKEEIEASEESQGKRICQ